MRVAHAMFFLSLVCIPAGCRDAARGSRTGNDTGESAMETATFAAGCFWGVEEAFRRVEGVMETTAGYTGGTVPEPSYRQVCSGTTGHVEAVRVHYDPSAVSYRRLLEVFFAVHDPTTPGRQGPDVGSQYRSVIFHHDEEQKREAVEAITAVSYTHLTLPTN